jgi:chemotaxis protein methyltransferase CheR
MKTADIESIELKLLLEAIFLKYGYDFRDYAPSSLRRRIRNRLAMAGLKNFAEMQHKLLHEPDFFDALLLDLSINVTEMFRDPPFFKFVRNKIVPALRELPLIKVWHAGCASGEEVYSMAVLLHEEGLYPRARLFATDFNQVILRRAKEGIFPMEHLKSYTANYQKSGGHESFSDYYTAHYGSAIMRRGLKKNIVFASHNLATDGRFGDMDVIMCRNVLIYFSRGLQNRALSLFRDSLGAGGFLCLGSKESLRFSNCADDFEEIETHQKIYRRK